MQIGVKIRLDSNAPSAGAMLPAGEFGSSFKPSQPGYRNTIMSATANRTWMCVVCGWVYDEAAGLPDDGIAPGTLWKDVPINWTCPECGARKEDFEMMAI